MSRRCNSTTMYRVKLHIFGLVLFTYLPFISTAESHLQASADVTVQADTENALQQSKKLGDLEDEFIAIREKPDKEQARLGDIFRRMTQNDALARDQWARLEPDKRLLALETAVQFGDAPLREAALHGLVSTTEYDDLDGRSVRALIGAITKDTDPDFRKKAIAAVKVEEKNERAVAGLVREMRNKNEIVRHRAVDALRELDQPRVVEAIVEVWRYSWGPGPRAHFFVARQRSYIADYEISGDSYDPIVRTFMVGTILDVKSLGAVATHYIVQLLEEVTRQRHGEDLEEWRKWWRAEQAKKQADLKP